MAKKARPPSRTFEGRENQLIGMATELAEKQLREGTASAQVITHYLKLGTTRERLEQERIRNENLVLQKKVEQMEMSQSILEMHEKAMEAMSRYRGEDM